MTQLTNDYIYEETANLGLFEGENISLFTGAGTTQTTAYPIKGEITRVVVNTVASAALSMKSILSNDNPQLVVIINDSANTVVVFPFKAVAAGATDTAENINGVATGFSIATATTGVFFASLVQPKRKGGTSGAAALNWSAATFS